MSRNVGSIHNLYKISINTTKEIFKGIDVVLVVSFIFGFVSKESIICCFAFTRILQLELKMKSKTIHSHTNTQLIDTYTDTQNLINSQ